MPTMKNTCNNSPIIFIIVLSFITPHIVPRTSSRNSKKEKKSDLCEHAIAICSGAEKDIPWKKALKANYGHN